jgi:hypothetical protein
VLAATIAQQFFPGLNQLAPTMTPHSLPTEG